MANMADRADIPKQKTDQEGVLQNPEAIDKAPVLNILEILAQTLFVKNDRDDDDKIN